MQNKIPTAALFVHARTRMEYFIKIRDIIEKSPKTMTEEDKDLLESFVYEALDLETADVAELMMEQKVDISKMPDLLPDNFEKIMEFFNQKAEQSLGARKV